MNLTQQINNHLPIGWHVTLLVHLDPEWQVNIHDGEYVVVATGQDIEGALSAASEKVHLESFAGRLNWLSHKSTLDTRPTVRGLSLRDIGLAGPEIKLPRPRTIAQ